MVERYWKREPPSEFIDLSIFDDNFLELKSKTAFLTFSAERMRPKRW